MRKVEDIQSTLSAAVGKDRWSAILKCFLPTGVADTKQMQLMTGLSRDQLNRALEAFREVAGSGKILKRVPFSVPRPGARGRSPVVYQLGPVGAELLRKQGYPRVHESGLGTPLSISHARAVLDVRLAALEAGLHVQTEEELKCGESIIRPDNLVTVGDGRAVVFEVEQWADRSILRRIVEGLERREDFFRCKPEGVSPTVRVLFNLRRGVEWDRTIQVWEQGIRVVVEHRGRDLSFRLVAMPMAEFLDNPDWGDPPEAKRWEPISNPLERKTVAAVTSAPEIPVSLAEISSEEDRIVLEAYLQYLQESSPREEGVMPLPSWDFFEVMKVIYAASNPPLGEDELYRGRNAFPYASVYLLRKYLEMHQDLRDALSKEMVRGANTVRWTPAVIMHRMQVVIETFMEYHGWRLGWGLHAYPMMPEMNGGGASFGVGVRIQRELIAQDIEEELGFMEVQEAELALSWVLTALFRYAGRLGLKRPQFW